MKRIAMFFLSLLVLTLMPIAAFAANSKVESKSWGSIKAMYSDSGRVVITTNSAREQSIVSEGVMSSPSDPAWMNPLAQSVIEKFKISPSDILAVQRVVMLSRGMPIDSADVVVTEKQWYYKGLVDGSFTTNPVSLPLTTEMDIYGSQVQLLTWHQDCWSNQKHWGVVFYLPVCFYELSPAKFDGIIDAWAPRPNCSPWCNGGLCSLLTCGDAWDGPGNEGWWNFHDVACNDYRASMKVAKIVQKRWLHTWQLCHGFADRYIASLVRARIRF